MKVSAKSNWLITCRFSNVFAWKGKEKFKLYFYKKPSIYIACKMNILLSEVELFLKFDRDNFREYNPWTCLLNPLEKLKLLEAENGFSLKHLFPNRNVV